MEPMEKSQFTHQLEEWQTRFEQDGCLLLRNVVDQEQVQRLNEAIDRMLANEPAADTYNMYHTVERDPAFLPMIDHRLLLPLAVRLLGTNIQLHISHLTVRKPLTAGEQAVAGSFINWHQDGPHPKFPRINGLTAIYYIKMCILLSDMSEPGRGNTKVIPGSHRIPDFKPVQHDVTATVDNELEVCGKPGDVFVFAQNLWHAGAPNYSAHTRRQLFIGYSPLWIRPIDYHRASPELLKKANPVQRQLLGEVSDNCFHYYCPRAGMLPLSSMQFDQ